MSANTARTLGHALRGEGAHVEVSVALDGMEWQKAGVRPDGAPHTVFQLLNHMIFWQDLFLRRLTGALVASPPHAADGWPGEDCPRRESDWTAAVERFNLGLNSVEALINPDTLDEVLPNWNYRTRSEAIALVASHNSYHLGQIVLVRRMLGAWPPPTGGDTW